MKKSILITVIASFFAVSSFAKTIPTSSNISVNKVIIADSTEFNDYYGSYKMVENQVVEKIKVFFKDGSLQGEAKDYPPTKMTRKKDDEFEETSFGAVITFTRTDGKVTGIKVAVEGQELVGTKE